MDFPSVPAHRRLVPRQGLLLAASLLTLWSLPTTAQLTIESVPPNAAEGKDVLLRVHNLPGNLKGYAWYKGEKGESNHKIVSYLIDTQKPTYWPAYSDRETIYHNGSLLFQNVTLNDTGKYMLQAVHKDFKITEVTGQLCIYPMLPKPNITSNNSNPEEHKDPVMLTCESQTENTTYLWLINSQSLQDSARLQLSKDNRTLTLLLVTRNDMGPYECEIQNPGSASRSDPFTLNVLSVLPKPSITSNNFNPEEHKDPVMLMCEPQTENTTYLWFINSQRLLVSARLQLSKDNRTLTILLVTRNDTGPYEYETQNFVSVVRSDPFILNVLYDPDAPTISPSNSHYLHGTNLSLSCQAASNPPAQYSWLINGRPLTTTQELFIPNITLHNSGSYICLTHNSDTGLTGAMVKNITVYSKCFLDHQHQAVGCRAVWFSGQSL
ncbi:unnamed protein product [Pipistrellus nathusii]|uniref:Ig-like domain-containing protein n=1 Tax=Pipistrellus nathusii TaxID=59473 RepID=A0ABN9ZFN3_PIPNA